MKTSNFNEIPPSVSEDAAPSRLGLVILPGRRRSRFVLANCDVIMSEIIVVPGDFGSE